MSIEAVRELETLASVCPELNMANYTEDDVRHLNDWAIEMSLLADKVAALPQAEAQQPATPKPVGFTYRAEIEYADFTGRNGSFWRVPPDLDDEAVPLYDHSAPSVPADVVRDAGQMRFILAAADDMTTSRYKSLCELLGVAVTEDFDLGAAIDAAMLAAK